MRRGGGVAPASSLSLSLSLSLCMPRREREEAVRRPRPFLLSFSLAGNILRSLRLPFSRPRSRVRARVRPRQPSFSVAARAARPRLSARGERPAEAVYDRLGEGEEEEEEEDASTSSGYRPPAARRRVVGFLKLSGAGGTLKVRQRTTTAVLCMLRPRPAASRPFVFPPKSISRSRRSGGARTRTHARTRTRTHARMLPEAEQRWRRGGGS